MSRMRFAVVFAALCNFGLAALAAADMEQDAEYRTFRIPDHRSFNWTVDLNGSGRQMSSNVPGVATREGQFTGSLSTTASWFYDSDAIQRRFSVSLQGNAARSHGERTTVDSLSHLETEATANNAFEQLSLRAGVRAYPWAVPLGFDLTVQGDGNLSQASNELENLRSTPLPVTRSRQRQEDDVSGFLVAAFITAGVGRVRDATVVYRTQLLEQRLRENGNLTGALSSETRRKLAALFYAESDFSAPHDRPAKFFWHEIERILREDGALDGGSLDAYAVFRVIEPAIEGYGISRPIGFFIGPLAAVTDQQHDRRITSRYEAIVTEGDSVLFENVSMFEVHDWEHFASASVGGRAEYHRPIGMPWQVDAFSAYHYTDRFRHMSVVSRGVVSWLVADRWFADASVSHAWNRNNAWRPTQRDNWQLTYSGTLAYFLEDAWRVGLRWVSNEYHETDRVQRNAEFQLGLTYQIAGRAEVPGIVEPVRMLNH